MAVVINGSGTVTGISVGGLPDDIVDSGTLADDAVDSAQLASGSVDTAHIAADQITSAILPAGTVLQVVEGGMDGTADHAAGATTYSTLFSASLTNVAASSTVVGWVNIQGMMNAHQSDIGIACFQGVRVMGGGTAADSCDSGLMMNIRRDITDNDTVRGNGMFIDSAPTTGTVQYDVKSINEGTFTIGRSHWTGDQRHLRPRNNIILMEIAV